MPPHAAPPVSALLEDIAVATGMPFPNLLYRRLAEHPDQLRHCWQAVAPGLRLTGGPGLRAAVMRPSASPASAPRLPAALPPRLRQVLLDVLECYDRGNSCNAVVVAVLLRGSAVAKPSATWRSAPQPWPAAPAIPPMLAPEAMTPPARAAVGRLATLLDPTGAVVPSLLRHLAAEPELLAAVEAALLAAQDTGELARRVATARRRVGRLATGWPTAVVPIADSGARSMLATFDTVIPRMLAVSMLLREATQMATDGAPS